VPPKAAFNLHSRYAKTMDQFKQGAYTVKPAEFPKLFMAWTIRYIRRLLPILALAIIPFCLLCFATSISDLRSYPGADLRPKIVGARLLAAGLNPYKSPTIGLQNDYYRTNNFITYTPALLMLYMPLSRLPFSIERFIYYCFDWLCVAIALYILQCSFCQTRLQKYMCWFVYAVFVICSYAFRVHLERGQYYTLLLLLTCHAAVSIKDKLPSWLSCVPASLLLLLRPTYGLMLIAALICMGARKWALRVTLIATVMFAVTLQFGGVQRWLDFMHTVHEQNVMAIEEIATNSSTSNDTKPLHGTESNVIEHIDFHKMLNTHSMNGTFVGVFSLPFGRATGEFSALNIAPSPRWINLINSACIVFILAGGLTVAFIARRRIVRKNTLIAYVFLWPLILEIFGPQRYFYTAVLEILPLLILLLDSDNFRLDMLSIPRFYLLATAFALGVFPSVVFQLTYNLSVLRGTALAASFLTLFVLPICLAIICVYSILVSPRRTGNGPLPIRSQTTP
jgi:hypothetical protein